MYWLLVGLVRSLKSSNKEALRKPLLCEDYSDLTSPTSNQRPGPAVIKLFEFENELKCKNRLHDFKETLWLFSIF